jgi:steroid 5-alpha reductase family enzyme
MYDAAMPVTKRFSRGRSLAICAVLYLLCGSAAILAVRGLGLQGPIAAAAAGDLIATCLVFAASAAFNNSSVYDPYWSVAPVPIAAFWAVTGGIAAGMPGGWLRTDAGGGAGLTVRGAVVLALLLAWAARLTFNWVRRWRGLGHEDWRYAGYRSRGPAAYWAVSFAGFHLMPTALVFLGCLTLYPVLAAPALPIRLLDAAALIVTAGAILIEARADHELARFLASAPAPGSVLDTGLWSVSRHPNYFGEVLFWWGLFLFGLAANPDWWWTVAGPAAITILFLVVSVPMMEHRMAERHPGYALKSRGRSPFLPWFPRSRSEEG